MGRGQELLDAAREGDRRTVEKILGQITKRSGPFTSLKRRGAGVNIQDDSGYTPLHHACLNEHKELVRLLLSADASPCIPDKRGGTPLHLAAFRGNAEIVAILLSHKNPPVNVDQLTRDHETAVLLAAQFDKLDVVKLLVAHGADVTIRNHKDESPLDLAAQYDRLDTVKYLLRVQPQLVDEYRLPHSKDKLFSTTPLHRASKSGREKVVEMLLDAGVDPNIRSYKGTPLHEAASCGKASVVRILLNNGADLGALDADRKTVHDLLDKYSGEANRKVRQVIRDFVNHIRTAYDSEEASPPFPVPERSPTHDIMKAPETQKSTNNNVSLLYPSTSSLTKNHSESFVKKLASKCLGLKAKFYSAPNISDNKAVISDADVKLKSFDYKIPTNTLLIGNSKFFKILSKKNEPAEVVCNDEFDTISLDRIDTLNRDSVVNRSNRSCPGFKNSLPNISENNELSDSHQSSSDSEMNCDKNNVTEAVNYDASLNIFEPRDRHDNKLVSLTPYVKSQNSINECYESYEFSRTVAEKKQPIPAPRPNVVVCKNKSDSTIYENVILEMKDVPSPALRIHLPLKLPLDEVEKKIVYENVAFVHERKLPEPAVIPITSLTTKMDSYTNVSSPSVSRSSTISSDSMVDESNLEDILLSQKSKSFRHSKDAAFNSRNWAICRTKSNASDFSDVTEVSAIENVDCSQDVDENPRDRPAIGTLPNKKFNVANKKELFRHKTFTHIETERKSTKVKDLPQQSFLKETLAHYHIRGTGHCIYEAPTVLEFISMFNRDTLYNEEIRLTKDLRNSYFETAICFCKSRPPRNYNSAENLLDTSQDEKAQISLDFNAFKNRLELISTTFRCFCDSGTCTFHSKQRELNTDLIVKFSAIKKSISTPNITLDYSFSTDNIKFPKNKSIPRDLEQPYTVNNSVEDTIPRNKTQNGSSSPTYTMSQPSTLTSSGSFRPYSIKDIAEAISLTSTTSSATTASDNVNLSLRKSSSEYSGHWSLQSCNSNVTIQSDASFKTCIEESSEDDSDGTLHSDAETVKSDLGSPKKPWVHSDSFRFGSNITSEINDITDEKWLELSNLSKKLPSLSSKYESGISVECSESSSCGSEDSSGIPRIDADLSLDSASLERGEGMVGRVRSGSGRRRWDEMEGTSEGDALSISSAASSCAPIHLGHHHDYTKVSPTPPKKPPRRNLSVSPTHANSPSSGYSYELRPHARSQDDLDDIPGAKHYLKHGRSVDQYVDGKLSYSEYEENHNSPRAIPVPNPRPSLLKQRPQPVAITAMYENIVVKEQNPRRKLRRNNLVPSDSYEPRMEERIRKYSNQEKSSLESLLDDQSMNSPSDCERYYEGRRVGIPLSPTHYNQPPTPDHPPPPAKEAERSIHERIRPLSQLIMEVVEEIRIRKKSQGDISNS